jgi:hypothetical protein
MRRTKLLSRGLAACWGLVLAPVLACGDDTGSPGSEMLGGDGDGDAMLGPEDASTTLDSGQDAAVLAPDAGPNHAECVLDPVELSQPLDDAGRRQWDLALYGDTFHVVYQATTCGNPGDRGSQGLRHLTFQSTGSFSEPTDLLNMNEYTCDSTRSPALGVTQGGMPVVYYAANNNGNGLELYRRELAGTTPQRLTDDMSSPDLEELIRFARFDQREVVAYVNNLRVFGNPGHGQLVTREQGQAEQEILSRSGMQHLLDLDLTAFPSGGGAVAWIANSPVAENRLQLLEGSGARKGDVIRLGGGVGSSIALATRKTDGGDEGAVVFASLPSGTTFQEITFRSFGPSGDLGAEKLLSTGNRDARNVAIAPFANGYVVAFRLVEGSGRPTPVIQLAFVSPNGNAPAGGGERTLAEASKSGGDLKVMTAPDGRIVVAYTDLTASGLTLRILRANCLE